MADLMFSSANKLKACGADFLIYSRQHHSPRIRSGHTEVAASLAAYLSKK